GGSNAEGEMGFALLNSYDFIDTICSGEGDIAFPAYIAALDAGEEPDVRGILQKGKATAPSSTASVTAMDALPEPDYTEYFVQFMATSFGPEEMAKADIPFESSRGCWWGAKSHCTFCGLNGSNMAFRSKGADRVLDELLSLKAKHGDHTEKFFAVDNIIDYRYFESLLPSLQARDLNLDLFYETKANLTRDQVRMLRDAHISKIQPGIESLSSSILKLMAKGVSALQNIQLLKLCKEFGVTPVWNIIYGFPGEDENEYARMAQMAPALVHLDPPTGFYRVRLDRFSPYFNDQEKHGLTNVRPFAQYGEVHPTLSDEQLYGLAYYFDFDYADGRDPDTYAKPLIDELSQWLANPNRGYLICEDHGVQTFILSTRPGLKQQLITLHGLDRAIHHLLDRPRSLDQVIEKLEPAGYAPSKEQVRQRIAALESQHLVVGENDRYLNLAIRLGEYKIPDKLRTFLDRAIAASQHQRAAA
ncbi:MAG: RiPP maturation radical SAM C-methyltransferase, partial [Pseudomonadota bacterium]